MKLLYKQSKIVVAEKVKKGRVLNISTVFLEAGKTWRGPQLSSEKLEGVPTNMPPVTKEVSEWLTWYINGLLKTSEYYRVLSASLCKPESEYRPDLLPPRRDNAIWQTDGMAEAYADIALCLELYKNPVYQYCVNSQADKLDIVSSF